jgi:hypothetical protein
MVSGVTGLDKIFILGIMIPYKKTLLLEIESMCSDST